MSDQIHCHEIAIVTETTPPKSVVPPKPATKSPWSSVNNELIQNRCWLCRAPFPRGKTKKVFQVSHLLTFYHNVMLRLNAESENLTTTETQSMNENADEITTDSTNGGEISGDQSFKFPMPPYISTNLQNCYNSYVELMAKGDGKPNELFAIFKEEDIEVWMSGLVCGISAECKQELAYFIDVRKHNKSGPGAANASRDRAVNEMFAWAMPKDDGCLPGCGCDNPWPFMP